MRGFGYLLAIGPGLWLWIAEITVLTHWIGNVFIALLVSIVAVPGVVILPFLIIIIEDYVPVTYLIACDLHPVLGPR